MAGPVYYEEVVGSAHLLGAVFAWALAALVLRSRSGARSNQLLAGLLYAEGLFQAIMMTIILFGGPTEPNTAPSGLQSLFPLALSAMFTASLLYLVFLGTQDVPLARRFRSSTFHRGLVAGVIVHALVASYYVVKAARGQLSAQAAGVGVVFLITIAAMVFASVYGLIACVIAWRRAKVGTTSRTRALAFVLAFGGRDIAFAIHIAGGPVVGNLLPTANGWYIVVVQSFLGIASIVFAVFLAYGFLRSQLFDIDLRIKLGIKRGTVIGLILSGFFAAAKITETYLNREVGFIAGSVCAGLLLFLVPKLNKIGDKVANVALPQVQPTNAYLSFKKMEVYRAAIESAFETGGVSEKERATLDKLREKLGLTKADTDAVEMELSPPATAPRASLA